MRLCVEAQVSFIALLSTPRNVNSNSSGCARVAMTTIQIQIIELCAIARFVICRSVLSGVVSNHVKLAAEGFVPNARRVSV
jgi:hypothetical protein